MRFKSPSSRASLKTRVAPFDLFWALVTPPAALFLRDVQILSFDRVTDISLYWAVSVVCSVLAFMAFRLQDGLASHFSVNDALDVVKAVVAATLLVLLILFTLTRLGGIPRSTPLIHALVLITGLLAARTVAVVADTGQNFVRRPPDISSDHIMMIGAGQLTLLYLRLLDAYLPGQHRVIGILDEKRRLSGRKLAGTPIVGPPQQLGPLIAEYALHGVRINRVLIGGDPDVLSESALKEVQRVCDHEVIRLEFVPELMGLWTSERPGLATPVEAALYSDVHLPRYLRVKPALDFAVALTLILVLSPLYLLAAGLVLFDLGPPVLFWQQRLGENGRTFLLHKFRTLQPPADWQGHAISPERRLSAVGRFLRKTRLDELPQLFNVVVGEMAVVGPRPLLPEDQPRNFGIRLLVRPGITGWAQVNGGKLLTAEEKQPLDDWYVRHASLWLDLRILLATIAVMLFGERRSAVAENTAGLVSENSDPECRPRENIGVEIPKTQRAAQPAAEQLL
jgi:lipopolysaccharide/colanic/teichoic acid biosynthesis glycosyltransferase